MAFYSRNLFRDAGGNIAIMTALAGIPMCVAVGAAVDYGRASASDAVVQAATDAAAIAAAADPKITDAKMAEIVDAYLTANGVDKAVVKISKVDVNADRKNGTVSVQVSGQFNTTLMNIAGISSLEIGGFSEVQTGGQALEVALVLDNTYSMTAEGRMDALKNASEALVDQLFGDDSSAEIKVSIVPFAEYVNVGVSNRNKLWLDVKPDYSETVSVDTYPNGQCLSTEKQTNYNDGIPYTADVCTNWDPGAVVKADQVYDYTWRGCVGSRTTPLDENIGTSSSKYPGLLNAWCNVEVLPPTSSKSALKSKINEMYPNGETYIPAGLLWGWNMLDASDPFGGAKSKQEMADLRGSKSLILMTDGDNTRSPDYPWHWGTNASLSDGKTAALCDNIKADGISIYTVALKVSKPESKQMLQTCASSPAMAFNADDNSALIDAFKQIASQLAAVHITR